MSRTSARPVVSAVSTGINRNTNASAYQASLVIHLYDNNGTLGLISVYEGFTPWTLYST